MSNRSSRRASLTEFKHEVADGGGLLTYLVDAADDLDHAPLLRDARASWRKNRARRMPKCFACKASFTGEVEAGAHLFSTADVAAPTAASISGLCSVCWASLTDNEIERAALRLLRRLKPGFAFKDAPSA